MTLNRHGLSRNIPEDVRLQVRQACGFGCVFCGSTITEYEHFAPDFRNASEHTAEGIALLCPNHHAQVTKGILRKQQVAEARRNPAALKAGFARERHPYFTDVPTLQLGDALTIEEVDVPIMVDYQPVIWFKRSDPKNPICQISMKFSDSTGKEMLSVEANEWSVSTGNWSFKSVANRYIFKGPDRTSLLVVKFEAPNRILIDDAHVFVAGFPLIIDNRGATFGSIHAHGGGYIAQSMVGIHFDRIGHLEAIRRGLFPMQP